MAGPYEILITGGTGTAPIMLGDYSVTGTSVGYDSGTIDPSTVTIGASGTYAFTIAATGTLTLHVTEDGSAGGTAVSGANFVRCDASGATGYGADVVSDASGDAVFEHMPFGVGAPTIYYMQTASDDNHIYDPTLKTTVMATEDETVLVENALPQPKTVTLKDEFYGLSLDGELTLTEV